MTLLSYVKGLWTALLPAATKAKMENIEDGIKAASDVLDLETDAGRAITQAADAAAQRTLLEVDSSTEVTAKADAAQAAAEATAAGALAGHVAAADPHVQYALEADMTPALAAKADLVGGKIPSEQLPAYVDDVIEYANLAAFPGTGETGKIYVALDTNLTYRWSGSAYVEISKSLALGESSSTAYRGDRGKELYDMKGQIPSTPEKSALAAGYSALAAGYTQLQALADAEATSALGTFNVAYQLAKSGRGQKLLTMMVQESSQDNAAVLFDDLGFPSMMFRLSGPKVLGYLHDDYGATTALKTAVLASPGSGYAAGEVLGIAGGTGGTIRILTVDGSGAVLTFRFANRGTGYSATTGAATTGGSGTGCTVTTTIGPVHPAFVVNGAEKTEILYSMFDATTFNGSAYNGSGAGWRAICWPGLFPTTSLNFDASKLACTAKGAGWHLGSIWENDLIKVLAMKGSTEPRGNTQYGRTHESGYQFNETAARYDGLLPGLASGTAKHRNGACPKFWSHNHDRWGIFDMVGNVWRWTDQLKLVNGEVFLTDDNYYGLAEASWPTTGAFFDGSGKLWGSVHAGEYVASVVHTSQVMDANYDALDLEIRVKLLKSGVTTKLAQASANPFSPKGSLWISADGERLPVCGGGWTYASDAGLAALALSFPRSFVYGLIGFRPAFISP